MNRIDQEFGIVYVATARPRKSNRKVLREVIRSLKLLRWSNPDIPVILVASADIRRDKEIRNTFPRIVPSKYKKLDGTMGAKIQALEISPFKKTLILDNDTLPIMDITQGFSFVGDGRWDIALAIAPRQELKDRSGITNFQNGVMFVNKCPRTLSTFEDWRKAVVANNPRGPTRFIFSKIIHDSPQLRVYPLSYFWNFRIDMLVDLEITPLKTILPNIRIFHSHLERGQALKIFMKHPRYREISRVIGLR